jgi:hypothetical protein
LLEFPDWFRSRRCGWLPFAYVHVVDLNQTGITDTMLTKYFLECTHNDLIESNSSDFVVIVPGVTHTSEFRFNVRLEIADWPQQKKTFNISGHNGSVCCYACQNVLGHCDYFEDPCLVHYKSTEYHKFLRHSTDSFYALVDRVEHAALHTPDQLKRLQQSAGIKYDPHGLLWDRSARARLTMPQAAYVDWMHTWVASGGVAQYEVNQLVLVLGDHGITRDDIDEWCNSVKLPLGHTRLKKHFFRDRVVDNRNRCIRAFASEVITAMTLLKLFLDIVVAPLKNPDLQPYIDCHNLLWNIIGILKTGDKRAIPQLRIAVHSHHILFARLYPQCMKTKIHAAAHVADYWEFWSVLLSCFGPERYHQWMKKIMKFAYNKACKTALAYAVRKWFADIGEEDTYSPAHFVGKVYLVTDSPRLNVPQYGVALVRHWGAKMQTPSGLVGQKDLIRVLLSGSSIEHLVFVVAFARLDVNGVLVVVVRVCTKVEGSQCWRRAATLALINVDQIVCSVPYADLGAEFYPVTAG